jgi:hypothetical protein
MGRKMRNFMIYPLITVLLMGCSASYQGELIFIEPETEGRFNYPYFLFIPDQVSAADSVYMLVEPNNSGFAEDDLQKHIEKAENTATSDYYLGSYMARKLSCPLLVPVFPREQTDWRIYTHALDRDAMLQSDNPLERIDLQLLAMFEDARTRLKNRDIQTHEQFLLTGFSASGTFANRFTLIHPERVLAVAAGGLNGLLMLPLDSLQNELLRYPIGTGDLQELTGRGFQKQAFMDTPQFYFMGRLDDNDAVPYDDAFDQDEREQVFRLLGEQMLPGRWNSCGQIYDSLDVNASVKTYAEVGHRHPDEIKEEIIGFFHESIQTY